MTKARKGTMDSEVGWGMSLILIVVAAAHIAEESVAGFRRFFNTQWFAGTEDCPVGRFKGLVVDKIGLFLFLALLAISGASRDARWIFIAIGIITADLAQHATFSIKTKGYTPGVATSAAYFVYVVYFFSRPEIQGLWHDPFAWGAMALGAAFILGNYLSARLKMRLGRCQPAGA
jgi:Protein of unknown function with HXXEE motif